MKKKTVLLSAIVTVLTAGAIIFGSHAAKAQGGFGNGSCAPATNFICGLNGVNYSNHKFVAG